MNVSHLHNHMAWQRLVVEAPSQETVCGTLILNCPARWCRTMLRRPRPADKCLGDPLTGAPAAEELGARRGSQGVGGDSRQEEERLPAGRKPVGCLVAAPT